MDENIPIDIHIPKLVDWLVSRRHIKKEWPEAVQKVRKKISVAIQDMPEHPDITKLLSGSYINYFHCLKIIEILRETEKDSKNIFGWYSSQRMKDWQEVVRLYEADNVNLAEASQFLVRNVGYEIPSLRRQITKSKKVQEECLKKAEASSKSSTMAKERFFSSCKKIGVTGDNLKEEFAGLLKNLPEKFAEIARKAKELQEARCLYEDFTHFLISPERSCLPLLDFVIKHGDATVYEWKYGEAPISIERQDKEIEIFREESTQINLDINEDIEKIDFGDEVDLETGDIDWGDISEEPEIIDNIDFGDNAENEDSTSFEIIVESSGVEGGVAKGEDALTIFMNESTRNKFISELMELQGFLTQRNVELKLEDMTISMNLFSNAPKRLQYQNIEENEKFLDLISEISGNLTSTGMQHLYMIYSSPRYVNRLIESLNQHLIDGENLLKKVEGFNEKREKSVNEEYLLNQHLKLILSRTKELQDNIKKQISQKYNNRVVNLMGGV